MIAVGTGSGTSIHISGKGGMNGKVTENNGTIQWNNKYINDEKESIRIRMFCSQSPQVYVNDCQMFWEISTC